MMAMKLNTSTAPLENEGKPDDALYVSSQQEQGEARSGGDGICSLCGLVSIQAHDVIQTS